MISSAKSIRIFMRAYIVSMLTKKGVLAGKVPLIKKMQPILPAGPGMK